ncbi:Hypothetical protein HVR_LOCUS746 [uncultured virus]|nr:Hypothetical protein HVR_LOCUS746 [uncultured virus]
MERTSFEFNIVASPLHVQEVELDSVASPLHVQEVELDSVVSPLHIQETEFTPIFEGAIQKIACEYFTKLFELGLYIRGWRGEGHPYIALDIRPKYEALGEIPVHLVNFEVFANSLQPDDRKELDAFSVCDYFDNENFRTCKISIGRMLSEIAEGRYSTFMASGTLISTGIYYLRERCRYEIPDVDIRTLKNFC